MRQDGNKGWLAGSGSYGCIYDNAEEYPTFEDAVQSLLDLFELRGTRRAGDLRRNRYVDLGEGFGADYAEIVKIV